MARTCASTAALTGEFPPSNSMRRGGIDVPIGGRVEQHRRGDVEAGVLEVEWREAEVVVDRGLEVFEKRSVVERDGFNGLQRAIRGDDQGPFVIVPAATLVAPRSPRQRLGRGLVAIREFGFGERDTGAVVDPVVHFSPPRQAGGQSVACAAVLPAACRVREDLREHVAHRIRKVLSDEPPVAGTGRRPREFTLAHVVRSWRLRRRAARAPLASRSLMSSDLRRAT